MSHLGPGTIQLYLHFKNHSFFFFFFKCGNEISVTIGAAAAAI